MTKLVFKKGELKKFFKKVRTKRKTEKLQHLEQLKERVVKAKESITLNISDRWNQIKSYVLDGFTTVAVNFIQGVIPYWTYFLIAGIVSLFMILLIWSKI